MSVTGLDHVAIPTADAERTIAFYRELGFGVPTLEAWRVEERRAFSIQFGDNKINILYAGDPDRNLLEFIVYGEDAKR